MHPKAKFLLTAAMDIDPDKEALFNEVYDKEHIPELLKVPGVLAAAPLRVGPAQHEHRWRHLDPGCRGRTQVQRHL